MDQSARILVEEEKCDFPTIGLWCKCDKLDHIMVYHRILQYLYTKKSNNKKCCFVGKQETRYIYFAKIS